MKSISDVITTLGETRGRPPQRLFGIKQLDRQFHMAVFGQTGTGKSSLLLQLVKQDVQDGRGLCLIDPHGDLAKSARQIAGEGAIYWNPADPQCPYGYNPLTQVSAEHRTLVASGLIETLKRQWSDAFGVRMEHLLRFAFLALLEQPNASLGDVMPLFLDKQFRYRVLHNVTDPYVLAFWNGEYNKLNYKGTVDGVAPIANKLGAFLAHPVVRKKICAPEKPLRFRTLMDERRVVIVNLAKGKLGADISNVLGGLTVSSYSLAAMSRENIPQAARTPCTLIADEFPTFTSDTFMHLLSELRKYGLQLCATAQYTSQLSPELREALFGNVGTLISFRVGANDASVLSKQFGADVPTPRDLVNLSNYHMFIKMMIDGEQTKPFTAKTIQPHNLQQ